VVRTFAPIVAGVGRMHYPRFLFYNLLGGGLWAIGLTTCGYWFGSQIPDPDKYLLPIILLIIFISILPTAVHVLRDEQSRASIALGLRKAMEGRRARG
jgi:membrane-associated protein